MRVITGSCRGIKLRSLDGMATRPTADRVKEGMFSAIQFEIEGRKVLDLFAGTGQLGIESLSRGASHAVFVDAAKDSIQVIRENLQKTKLTQISTILQSEAITYLEHCREQFGLIFLDPPYQSGLLNSALKKISEIDILSDGGIIVCEYAMDQQPRIPETFSLTRDYRYGKTGVALIRRSGKEKL